MSTTTVTTEPPPSLEDAVWQRVRELSERGARVLTVAAFRDVVRSTGCSPSRLMDRLLVLEGIGVLRATHRGTERAWTINLASECLR